MRLQNKRFTIATKPGDAPTHVSTALAEELKSKFRMAETNIEEIEKQEKREQSRQRLLLERKVTERRTRR